MRAPQPGDRSAGPPPAPGFRGIPVMSGLYAPRPGCRALVRRLLNRLAGGDDMFPINTILTTMIPPAHATLSLGGGAVATLTVLLVAMLATIVGVARELRRS